MTGEFSGFVLTEERAVEVPVSFFTEIAPRITEIAELQVLLAMFRLAADAGGLDAPVSHQRLTRDRALRTALRVPGSPREPDERIATGIDLAVGRGVLLAFAADTGREQRLWYYVNTPVNQGLVSAMSRGAATPPATIWHGDDPPEIIPERPNVFRLYEQNIGLLTPLIADSLIDALERYPREWIEDAITEAVAYNRRSWRYVQRILEQWSTRGREGPER